LFDKFNSNFLKRSIITTNVTVETKKRQKRNAKGSIVTKPTFIIGKEVPHKMPASIVKKKAFLLVVNSEFGKPLHSLPF
jgi:hypothetical protein